MVKWEARFIWNGKKKSEVISGPCKEQGVRKLIKAKYPGLTDADIYVNGAFDPIPGRKLILGSHAINSSLDLGFPYSKYGNRFYELLGDDFEELRKIVERENGTPQAEEAKKQIVEKLKSMGIGVADVMEFCYATNSSDKSVDLSEPICWNPDLVTLIKGADVVYFNSMNRKKGRKGPFVLLKEYCERFPSMGMKIDGDYIVVGDHRARMVLVYSSSGSTYPQFSEKRKAQWSAITSE